MHSWSRGDKIALWSLVVAIVSCVVAIRSMPRPDSLAGTNHLRMEAGTDTSVAFYDTLMAPPTADTTMDTLQSAWLQGPTVVPTTDSLVTVTTGPAEDSASVYYTLGLKNSCTFPIYVVLNHRDEQERWRTRGWWKVEPGATTYPDGVRSLNSIFYIYAETESQQLYWDGSKTAGSIVRNVPQHAFEHRDDLPTPFATSRPLSFFMRQISGTPTEYVQEFTC